MKGYIATLYGDGSGTIKGKYGKLQFAFDKNQNLDDCKKDEPVSFTARQIGVKDVAENIRRRQLDPGEVLGGPNSPLMPVQHASSWSR